MKRAPNQPVDELVLYAGIYLRTWTVPDANTLLPQHAHRWDHLSLIVSGAVAVYEIVDGGSHHIGNFTAGQTVKIAALAKHSFLTRAPNTVIACIHATEAAEVEIAAEHQLQMED
jgi:hypothetical protein